MKKILAFLVSAVCAVASVSAAEGSGSGTKVQGQTQQTAAASTADNAGNAQSIVFNAAATPASTQSQTDIRYSGSYETKNVPAFVAPALTSSNDTCMGSSSVGGAGAGFGIAIGSTWTDKNCVMLKNARELYNMGMPDAAFARLCMDDDNRDAIELTGRVCPQTKKAKEQQAAQQASAQ